MTEMRARPINNGWISKADTCERIYDMTKNRREMFHVRCDA